jgi:hypothetical protein
VAGKPNGKSPNITAEPVGRLFFPQSKSLGLDRSQYSNAVLAKITYAGSNNTSYQQAQADLDQLAELKVSDKQVRRLANESVTNGLPNAMPRWLPTRCCRW